ncbi:MAG: hypothetical protein ACREM8_07020 [Vulcanimicrobiaceae bacterium]
MPAKISLKQATADYHEALRDRDAATERLRLAQVAYENASSSAREKHEALLAVQGYREDEDGA